MMLVRVLVLALLIAAQSDAAERRYTTDAEAEAWRAVGLVDWRGRGRCTGALIQPDVVLTAAHCVADAASRTIEILRFNSHGRKLRRCVTGVAPSPTNSKVL